MRLKILLPLLTLVLVPLAALGWLGMRMSVDQQVEIEGRFQAILADRLDARALEIGRGITDLERRLDAFVDGLPNDVDGVRQALRRGRFPNLLRFDAERALEFPPVAGPTSARERSFLARTEALWRDGWFTAEREGAAVTRATRGWRVWYSGGGLNLFYWRRASDGVVTAVEVDRARLLAWVLRSLPALRESAADERIALLDSAGRPLYQWGAFEPAPDSIPRAEQPLEAPLSGWRLTWHGPPSPNQGVAFGLFLALASVGLALVGLAVYFYRASGAEARQATRRVTFVNQVSHELKTPLTNIRMYADLLDEALDDPPPDAGRYLRVIVEESERLTRLIANVLSFARDQRGGLTLRLTEGTVDAVVEGVVDTLRPSLRRAGLEAHLSLTAGAVTRRDVDAIGQIVANLLSNVEKYAGAGGHVWVTTRAKAGWTIIDVRDAGPGISATDAERVFEPFQRLSDALEEGVAGTGIGLGIARRLARLHGGDLHLEPSDAGAHFRVRLRTEESP